MTGDNGTDQPRAYEARDVVTERALKAFPVRDGDTERARAYAQRYAKRRNLQAGDRVAYVARVF